MKLYLDPGHGGTDTGGTGNGLQEKNVNLDIALRIRNILNRDYEGHSVRMSRTTDSTVNLATRTNAANNWGADYFLSIHTNAFNGRAEGYEDYIFNSSVQPNTVRFRDLMHEEIRKQTDFVNRGKKRQNFHVLRETHMSAVLTENGFIDHAGDAAKLKQSAYLDRIAQGHVNGLVRIFNLKRKASAPPNNGDLYYVQLGAFNERNNANRLMNLAKNAGFHDAYVKSQNNLFKVQIGAFSKKSNADNLAAKAKNAGFDVYIAR